jgi:hypothetical protein
VQLFRESIALLEDAKKSLPEARLGDDDRKAAEINLAAALAITSCLLVERTRDERSQADGAERAARAFDGLQQVDTFALADDNALYNLACSFAVASDLEVLSEHRVDLERCMRKAKECFLQACLKKQEWWDEGTLDPDLRALASWMPEARQQMVATPRGECLDRAAVGAIISSILGESPDEPTVEEAIGNGRPRVAAP